MVDLLVVLFAWRPYGSMRTTRYFELSIVVLVIMVVACFITLFFRIDAIALGNVLKGCLPNSKAFSKSSI